MDCEFQRVQNVEGGKLFGPVRFSFLKCMHRKRADQLLYSDLALLLSAYDRGLRRLPYITLKPLMIGP